MSPNSSEIRPAALRLLERHGRQILATARRYSASPDDAEDAYQRGFEILLTKAPTTREEELVPWLKTVVKHEAFAIRRQRERATPAAEGGEPPDRPGPEAAAHDQAERYERLRVGAEALRRLKPQEVRCLLLRAEGYSYKEICRLTGWTYTKVNRCLTEGRKAFLQRVAGIEAGRECERLAPALSRLVDGEAGADEVRALRPHLRGCLACRARLRVFRGAPARAAAALAPPALAGGHGPLRGLVESLVGAAQHKVAALGERAHVAGELATGQKIAAVAATAAAVGGGGAGATHLTSHSRAHAGARAAEVRRHTDARPVAAPAPPVRAPEPEPGPPAPPPPTPVAQPPPAPAPPPPAPEREFAPAAGASAATAPARSGGGEFGP